MRTITALQFTQLIVQGFLWPAEGTRLTCVCFLSVLATPTHHHGHSCLRLRVYVCCSTGETQHLCLTSIGLSHSFSAIFSLSVSVYPHFPLPSYLFVSPKHTNIQRNTKQRERKTKIWQSCLRERLFCLALSWRGFDDGVFSLGAALWGWWHNVILCLSAITVMLYLSVNDMLSWSHTKDVKGKKTDSAVRSSSFYPPSLSVTFHPSLLQLSWPSPPPPLTVYLFFSLPGSLMPAALYSVCYFYPGSLLSPLQAFDQGAQC